MNLHLNRRLEVLAREIAEAKKPRISEGETLMFQLAARSPQYKTLGDLKGGGTLLEVAQALAADEAPPVAPPSVQKFEVGDRVRSVDSWQTKMGLCQNLRVSGFERGWIMTENLDEPAKKHGGWFDTSLELIEPAPSPASETETEALVVGMPYWCETIWEPTFCLWLGDGWFGCTPSAKLLRGLFLNGEATKASYKTDKEITKVIRAATEAELVKP